MTKSLDFLSENWAFRKAKTDFLSFVVQELLTFECVVSNRSPPGPLIKKFCLIRIGLISTKYLLFFCTVISSRKLGRYNRKKIIDEWVGRANDKITKDCFPANKRDEWVGRANDKITKDCFPANKRDAWLQKFKRFNTAILSSAAVERLFAVGSDILRLKRLSMTKENFEKFALLRENEKCLKKVNFSPRITHYF